MGTKVICKMRCESSTLNRDGSWSIEMWPVTGGSEENKKFFKYTPGGKLVLTVLNEPYFQPGQEYYVTITDAAGAAPQV